MSNFQRIAKIGYHILIWKFTLLTIIVYGRPVFMAFVGNPFPRIYIPTNLYTIIFFKYICEITPPRTLTPMIKNDSTVLACTIYLFHLQNRNWRKKRMNTNQEEVVIHWFRHGLRLHDNPSLIDGLSECDRFYPVFIFDGEVAGNLLFFFEKGVKIHLWQFEIRFK